MIAGFSSWRFCPSPPSPFQNKLMLVPPEHDFAALGLLSFGPRIERLVISLDEGDGGTDERCVGRMDRVVVRGRT